MALKLTYEHPDFPKGTPFAVFPLGQLSNGEGVEITEEQEAEFIATRGMTVKDAFAENSNIKVTGTAEVTGKQAATLIEAATPAEEDESTTPAEDENGGES
jgi:hypothetical protein